jgi:hypothetical protein
MEIAKNCSEQISTWAFGHAQKIMEILMKIIIIQDDTLIYYIGAFILKMIV